MRKPNSKPQASKQLQIYLPEDQFKAVNLICASTGVTRTALVKEGIFYFLKAAEALKSGASIGTMDADHKFTPMPSSALIDLGAFAESLSNGLSKSAKLKRGRPATKKV